MNNHASDFNLILKIDIFHKMKTLFNRENEAKLFNKTQILVTFSVEMVRQVCSNKDLEML